MNSSVKTSYFQGQIDPTLFGVVRNYLTSPRSPIQHVLHVREPEMLPQLAATLDSALRSALVPQAVVQKALDPLIAEGSLRISSREHVQSPIPGAVVDPACIPRSAGCRVIYLPPFYLVHTPGLFEGTLQVNKSQGRSTEPPKTQEQSQAQGPAQNKTKDYGISH
jgi:hypothetical protein